MYGFEAEIISHQGHQRKRQQLVVCNPTPEALWQLRDHPGIAEVEVHTPSLEEIFVAFLSSPSPSPSATTDSGVRRVDQASGGATK